MTIKKWIKQGEIADIFGYHKMSISFRRKNNPLNFHLMRLGGLLLKYEEMLDGCKDNKLIQLVREELENIKKEIKNRKEHKNANN